jgi:hypothetical protein
VDFSELEKSRGKEQFGHGASICVVRVRNCFHTGKSFSTILGSPLVPNWAADRAKCVLFNFYIAITMAEGPRIGFDYLGMPIAGNSIAQLRSGHFKFLSSAQ